MQIIDKSINEISSDKKLNSHFISAKNNKLDIKCSILKSNFFLDAHNYFPISEEYHSFLELFCWSEKSKYNIFYTEDFIKNFESNFKQFDTLSDVYILGSSSNDNYYRNLITFLPRLFFIKEKKIKLAIHRKSSNKYRNFLKKICENMNIDIQFIFLDDGFYKFKNSQIPQFLEKKESIKILNNLRITKDSPKDKIYLTRQNASYRNLINEADLVKDLIPLGFKVIDLNYHDIFEQIKIFSNAKVIVGPTGSAFANIVFCNPETKIIEITPKYNFEYEDIFKFRYRSICELLSLKHTNIDADSIPIKKIESSIKNIISEKILNESNYYKNLIIKLDKVNIINNF